MPACGAIRYHVRRRRGGTWGQFAYWAPLFAPKPAARNRPEAVAALHGNNPGCWVVLRDFRAVSTRVRRRGLPAMIGEARVILRGRKRADSVTATHRCLTANTLHLLCPNRDDEKFENNGNIGCWTACSACKRRLEVLTAPRHGGAAAQGAELLAREPPHHGLPGAPAPPLPSSRAR